MLLWSLWLVTTRDPRVVEEGFAPCSKEILANGKGASGLFLGQNRD